MSTLSHFTTSIQTNLFPTITGIIVLVAIVTIAVSSITHLRKLFRFIPFYIIHWAGAVLVYLLLILHGINYYNPSFWKWLLPAAIIFTLERVYRLAMVHREKVLLKCAGAYDDVSRVAIVEMNKPKGFRFEPGQHMMLNLPWIGTYICATHLKGWCSQSQIQSQTQILHADVTGGHGIIGNS